MEIQSASDTELQEDGEDGQKLPRTVQLRLVFTKIGDIDTVRECFEASVYLEAEWREPLFDGAAAADLRNCWHPDLYVDNCIGDIKRRLERQLLHKSAGRSFVQERHSLRGKFFERMELWHFPFDTQDITVTVCSNLPETAVNLVEMSDKPSQVLTSTFTDEQEWRLHTHVEAARASIISDAQILPGRRPALQFTTRAARRCMYYVANIWFVSFVLCMLALCVFGIDRQQLQARLQLSFLLLLTTVTFKFVVANSIPRISYFTILDKGIMCNLVFLVLLSLWHCGASLFPPEHELQRMEKFAIVAFAAAYVISVCMLALQVACGALRRRRLMQEKDSLHQLRLQEATKDGAMEL